MKKIISTIFLCLSVLCISAQHTRTLEILHTNDTHSCIMPLNPNLADTLVAGRGGFLRRLAMIQQERRANPDVLLFDSGDFSQGSPYYTLFKGEVEIELMNRMGYDVVRSATMSSTSVSTTWLASSAKPPSPLCVPTTTSLAPW